MKAWNPPPRTHKISAQSITHSATLIINSGIDQDQPSYGMEEKKPQPVEEVVDALLEFFVAPILPLKRPFTEPPSLSQQQSVAKQMHAVVLLYNYYHRRLHPQFKFLTFASFCKLVVVLRPALIAYMKLMHLPEYSDVDDLENHLSATEKAIMDACAISKALDTSKDIPGTKNWPIIKVAVLLVDSKMENCLLQHGAETDRAWSVIEKEFDVCKVNSEGKREGNFRSKRKRTSNKLLTDNQSSDDNGLQQLAMLAVKEVTDLDQSDITVLESHVVYSLSKEKSAARFYVMQSTRSRNEDFQVPIIGSIKSLQGPLVKKTSCGWMVTPVVEYFHLFPYAGILLNWIPREFGVASSISNLDNQSIEARNRYQHQKTCFPSHSDVSHYKEVDDSLVFGSQNEGKGQSCHNVAKGQYQRGKISSPASNIFASTIGIKTLGLGDDSVKLNASGCEDNMTGNGKMTSTISSSIKCCGQKGDCAALPSHLKSQYLGNQPDAYNPEENALSHNALKILLRKREELLHQMLNLEHKIGLCDKTIQNILTGGEDSLVLKIDTIIEGCTDAFLKEAADQDRKDFEGQDLSRQLSKAVVSLQNPCQRLDDICHKNIWILPTYRVYLSEGGFRSYVTVKGVDFEISCGSETRSSPQEARMSASLNMIVNLQNIASQIH